MKRRGTTEDRTPDETFQVDESKRAVFVYRERNSKQEMTLLKYL